MTVRTTSLRALTFALLTLAAGLVALSTSTAPARAGLGVSCPDPASQVFKPWGDYAYYGYAPNGGFESGSTGWALSGGAKVVAGNESFFVHGAGERYALSLPSGSSATSPPMCVSLLNGKMRFFAANGGSPSKLKVQVLYRGGVGGLLGSLGSLLGVADVGYVSAGPAWQPSTPVGMLGGTLPLLTQSVQFRFTPVGYGGAWQIDDVYLDPVIHR